MYGSQFFVKNLPYTFFFPFLCHDLMFYQKGVSVFSVRMNLFRVLFECCIDSDNKGFSIQRLCRLQQHIKRRICFCWSIVAKDMEDFYDSTTSASHRAKLLLLPSSSPAVLLIFRFFFLSLFVLSSSLLPSFSCSSSSFPFCSFFFLFSFFLCLPYFSFSVLLLRFLLLLSSSNHCTTILVGAQAEN